MSRRAEARAGTMAWACLALLVAVPVRAAAAGPPDLATGSPLAYPLVAGGARPELILAQRAIEREWGLPDSAAKPVPIEGWRSEAVAALLSAAVPGAGQAYSGSGSAMWFALAEVAGWTSRVLLRRSGDRAREDAMTFAGAPNDSASAWSFSRWESVTRSSAGDLEALYRADPEAFYDLIGSDPQYLAGWVDNSAANQSIFLALRAKSDRRLRGARFSESMIWINHVVAAVDALRAARVSNMRLGPNLGLRVRSGWRHGAPEVVAMFERRF